MNKGDVMKNELKTEIVGKFPCRDCKERSVRCHQDCLAYSKFKEEHAKTKKVINDYRKDKQSYLFLTKRKLYSILR